MKSKVTTVMKGIGAVMTVGGAAVLGTGTLAGKSVKNKAKKTASRAIDTMDDVITAVQNMLK